MTKLIYLSNYATKANLKSATGIDTSKMAAKSDLASLKAKVYKSDIYKLVSVPLDWSKLNDVVKNDVFKNPVDDKLVSEENNIDTSGFVLKAKYDTHESDLEKKISHTSGLVKTLDYNANITEIEGKTSSISGLATNAALTTDWKKIPNFSSLVKKQIITQELLTLKRNLMIIIMIDILLLQNVISLRQKSLMEDYPSNLSSKDRFWY